MNKETMIKAVYPGSFDPFTVGHLDVLKKSAKLFDEVIVLVSVNFNKKRRFDADKCAEAIRETVKELGLYNVKVDTYSGLVVEYAKITGASYIIRGLRNSTDYAYEENIALVNKKIDTDIETVYLRAEDAAVSSSMVMELFSLGMDVSVYVPEPVKYMMLTDNTL